MPCMWTGPRKKIDDAASALEAVSQRSKILKDHLARAEKIFKCS